MFVLEDPGVGVVDETACRPEARAGLMSDLGLLPIIQVVWGASSYLAQTCAVGVGIFLGGNFDGGEVGRSPERPSLSACSAWLPLVMRMRRWREARIGQGLGDAGEQLDLLVGDGLRRSSTMRSCFSGGDGRQMKALEAGDQRAAEAGEAVAVGEDGFALDFVELLADLLGGVFVVVEVGDEGGDGALEVDVVFPEGVVGVDEQGLAGGKSGGGWSLGHGDFVSGFKVTKALAICGSLGGRDSPRRTRRTEGDCL